MAVSITAKGSDLKIDEGTETNYYPIDDIQQRVVGTTVEFWLNGDLIKSFSESEFTTPTGTAAEIGDAISGLSTIASGTTSPTSNKTFIDESQSSVSLISSNSDRLRVVIINNSNKSMFLGFGVAAISDEGIELSSGDSWVDNVFSGEIFGIWGNAANNGATIEEVIK